MRPRSVRASHAEVLGAGGDVEVAIVTEVRVRIGTAVEQLDLSRKPERMLVEAFLIEQAQAKGVPAENIAGTRPEVGTFGFP